MNRTPRVFVASLVLLLMIGAGAEVPAASGGPDGGGYVWKDSDTRDVPAESPPDSDWEWTGVSLGDDSVLGPLALPWPINFYGADFAQFWLSDNGWLALADPQGDSHPVNRSLPLDASPAALVAPFWDDLDVGPALVRWGPIPSRDQYKVEWRGQQKSTGEPLEVELYLYREGCLRFHYPFPASQGVITVGTQDLDRSAGTLVMFDDSNPSDVSLGKDYSLALCPASANSCGSLPVSVGNTLTTLKDQDDVWNFWWYPLGACADHLWRSSNKDMSDAELVPGYPPDHDDRGAVSRPPSILYYQVEARSCFVCSR